MSMYCNNLIFAGSSVKEKISQTIVDLVSSGCASKNFWKLERRVLGQRRCLVKFYYFLSTRRQGIMSELWTRRTLCFVQVMLIFHFLKITYISVSNSRGDSRALRGRVLSSKNFEGSGLFSPNESLVADVYLGILKFLWKLGQLALWYFSGCPGTRGNRNAAAPD